jgi:ATP-dependent exoDNAse (exonuclease V) beta subunit
MFTHLTTIQPLELKTTEGNQGRFYHVADDVKYPSITTILGAGEKPHLASWRESLGVEKADKETKRCSDRGTAVHLMIERFLQNDPDPTQGCDFAHANEFRSVKMMLRNIDNILLQEGALYSDILKTAGRVDCIAEYKGKLAIIDFKTSTNTKNTHMIQDYYLQTTAYAWMLEELYDIHVEDIVIIMSVENGLPMVFKEKTEHFIQPLCERINTYYKNKRVK